MSTIIQLKRGMLANLPANAKVGEPLITTDSRELFIGMGEGQPLKKVSDIVFVATDALLPTAEKYIGKIYVVEADASQSGKTTMYRYTAEGFKLIGGGDAKFSDLIDVEALEGNENKALIVKSDASGLTYIDVATQEELEVAVENFENSISALTTSSDSKIAAVQSSLDAFKAEKGANNGLATLDATGKVSITQIPSIMKEGTVVTDIDAMEAITEKYTGLRVFVLDATDDETVEKGGAEYVFNGTEFVKISEVESMDLVLSWSNLLDKPVSSVQAIDAAVAKAEHVNRESLDKIVVAEDKTLVIDGQKVIEDTVTSKVQTWSSDKISVAIANVSTGNNAALTAEIERATAEEARILGIVNGEIARAEAAELVLTNSLEAHTSNKENPHGVAVSQLKDVSLTNAATGNFLMYDGANWINSSALDGGSF